VYMNVLFLLH